MRVQINRRGEFGCGRGRKLELGREATWACQIRARFHVSRARILSTRQRVRKSTISECPPAAFGPDKALADINPQYVPPTSGPMTLLPLPPGGRDGAGIGSTNWTRKSAFDRPMLRDNTYPFDRTKRSRLNQCELLGFALMNLEMKEWLARSGGREHVKVCQKQTRR